MIVRPAEVDGVVNNPWMGWGLWAGPIYFDGTPRTLEENTIAFGGDAPADTGVPLFDWVLVDWMWADLEPREGQFRWEELDAVIEYWASRGKQINLRVWVTDDPGWNGAPGASEVCPNWVYEAGLRWHPYVGEDHTPKREPDYADPSYEQVYLPRLQNLLTALAERYDRPRHPFNFLGCMGYGQWGEWHTMWSRYAWPSKQVKHDTLARIVNTYGDTFKHVDLAISYCFDTFNFDGHSPAGEAWGSFHDRVAHDDPEDFKYRQALDVALECGFLLGRHGFIDGLWYTDRVIMEAEWRRTALYAEANWSYLDVKNHGTHGTVDENVDVMLEWHSNYGHFYTDAAGYQRAMDEDAESFARGLKSGGLGYRLVLTEAAFPDQVRPGQLLLLKQRWANRNVGRCYKRHPLGLFLLDQAGREVYSEMDKSFDQTSWVRGQSYELTSIFHLPAGLPEGVYDLRIAMTDWEGNPALRLAITGDDANGYARRKCYRLGQVRVASDADRGDQWAAGWCR
jgi:hypothetical protein